jgi:uncharacterized protein YoxC
MTKEELKELLEKDTEVSDFFKAMVSTELESQTVGLKTKNQELLEEKKQLQEKLKGVPTKEELETFRNFSKQINSSEEAKLIAEGKFDDVITKRTEKVKSDYETQLSEISSKFDTTKKEKEELLNKYNSSILKDEIMNAARNAGVIPQAYDDIFRRARDIFSVEDGQVLSRDKDGKLASIDGKTLTTKLFIENLKETAPYYWPTSKGANLGGDSLDVLAKMANNGDIEGYLSRRRKQKQGDQK